MSYPGVGEPTQIIISDHESTVGNLSNTGFSPCDLVYNSSAGWLKADYSALKTLATHAVSAVRTHPNGVNEEVEFLSYGIFKCAGHGLGEKGDRVYLGSNGSMTTTLPDPVSNIIYQQVVGVIIDKNTLFLHFEQISGPNIFSELSNNKADTFFTNANGDFNSLTVGDDNEVLVANNSALLGVNWAINTASSARTTSQSFNNFGLNDTKTFTLESATANVADVHSETFQTISNTGVVISPWTMLSSTIGTTNESSWEREDFAVGKGTLFLSKLSGMTFGVLITSTWSQNDLYRQIEEHSNDGGVGVIVKIISDVLVEIKVKKSFDAFGITNWSMYSAQGNTYSRDSFSKISSSGFSKLSNRFTANFENRISGHSGRTFIDSAGVAHSVFVNRDNVYYSRSLDGGVTNDYIVNITENTASSSATRNLNNPNIVADGANIHIVWRANTTFAPAGSNYLLYHRYSTDYGVTWQTFSAGESPSKGGTVVKVHNAEMLINTNPLVIMNGEDAGGNRRIYRSVFSGGSWQNATVLSGSGLSATITDVIETSNISASNDGLNVHVVFAALNSALAGGTDSVIHHIYSADFGTNFDNAVHVDTDRLASTNAINPHCVINGSTLHVAWSGRITGDTFNRIYYRTMTQSGTWQNATATILASSNESVLCDHPLLSASPVMVLYRSNTAMTYALLSTTWQGHTALFDFGNSVPDAKQWITTFNNQTYVTIEVQNGSNTNLDNYLLIMRYNDSAQWKVVNKLIVNRGVSLGTATGDPLNFQFTNPRDFSYIRSGIRLHLVYVVTVGGNDAIYYTSAFDFKNWDTPELVSTNSVYSSHHQSGPKIAIDSNGNIHCVWTSLNDDSSSKTQIVSNKRTGGVWGSTKVLVSNDAIFTGHNQTAGGFIESGGSIYTTFYGTNTLFGVSQIYSNSSPIAVSWGTPSRVTDDTGGPASGHFTTFAASRPALVYDGSNFISVYYSDNKLHNSTSVNGTTWAVNAVSSTPVALFGAAVVSDEDPAIYVFGGNTYASSSAVDTAASNKTTPIISSSADGLTWGSSIRPFSSLNTVFSALQDGNCSLTTFTDSTNLYLGCVLSVDSATDNTTLIAESADGTTWDSRFSDIPSTDDSHLGVYDRVEIGRFLLSAINNSNEPLEAVIQSKARHIDEFNLFYSRKMSDKDEVEFELVNINTDANSSILKPVIATYTRSTIQAQELIFVLYKKNTAASLDCYLSYSVDAVNFTHLQVFTGVKSTHYNLSIVEDSTNVLVQMVFVDSSNQLVFKSYNFTTDTLSGPTVIDADTLGFVYTLNSLFIRSHFSSGIVRNNVVFSATSTASNNVDAYSFNFNGSNWQGITQITNFNAAAIVRDFEIYSNTYYAVITSSSNVYLSISFDGLTFNNKLVSLPVNSGETNVNLVSETPLTDNLKISNESFGDAVAIDDSGSTMVVGVPDHNTDEGRAIILQKHGNYWNFAAELTEGVAGSNEGVSVAISGNGNIVAVGAPNHSSSTGRVLVYEKPLTGWSSSISPAILTGNGTSGEEEGASVSLDLTGRTLVVGVPSYSSGRGRVLVYYRPAGGFVTTSSFDASLNSNGGFELNEGASVAVSQDGNVIVAGVPNATGSLSKAHVYVNPGSNFTTTFVRDATLLYTATTPLELGSAVDISADGTTIVAGAPDSGSNGAAAVYLRGGSWSGNYEPSATLSAGISGSSEGFSVTISQDASVIFSGAPLYSTSDGCVFRYDNPGPWSGGLTPDQTISLSQTGTSGSKFGISCDTKGLSGDLLCVGALDVGTPPTGRVFCFGRNMSKFSESTINFGSVTVDSSGATVAFSGISTKDLIVTTTTQDFGETWGPHTILCDESTENRAISAVKINRFRGEESLVVSRDLTAQPSVKLDTGIRGFDRVGMSHYTADYSATNQWYINNNISRQIRNVPPSTPAQGTGSRTWELKDTIRTFIKGMTPNDIAISRNGRVCAVSIADYNDGVSAVGATFVFVNAGAGDYDSNNPLANQKWQQRAVLTTHGATKEGQSVSISGDGTVIAVGSSTYSSNEGRSYIYTAVEWGNKHSSDAILEDTANISGDLEGSAIAICEVGDVVAVGAPGGDFVNLYQRSGFTWTGTLAPVKTFLGTASTDFGFSVALSSSGLTLAVGAPLKNTNAGEIRLMQAATTSWAGVILVDQVLTPTGTPGRVGDDVSLSPNGRILAAGGSSTNTDGAVHVWVEPNTGWRQYQLNPPVSETAILTTGASTASTGKSVYVNNQLIVAGEPTFNGTDGRIALFIEPSGGFVTTSTPTATFQSGLLSSEGERVVMAESNNTIISLSPSYNANEGLLAVYHRELANCVSFGSFQGQPIYALTDSENLFVSCPKQHYAVVTERTTLVSSNSVDIQHWTNLVGFNVTAGVPTGTLGLSYGLTNSDGVLWYITQGGFTRIIARRLTGGVYEYNSNVNFELQTYTASSQDTVYSALNEALSVPANLMDHTDLNSATVFPDVTNYDFLDFAVIIESGSESPFVSGIDITYDASTTFTQISKDVDVKILSQTSCQIQSSSARSNVTIYFNN